MSDQRPYKDEEQFDCRCGAVVHRCRCDIRPNLHLHVIRDCTCNREGVAPLAPTALNPQP